MLQQETFLFTLICIVVFVHDAKGFTCMDNQRNTRKPGDVWLEDPKKKCTCTSNNSVVCERLFDPVCLDVNGKFRKNFETWLNGSCVECACVNGSVNCTVYDVIITPGLYKVDVSPTCQLCEIRLQTALSSNACIAFRRQRAKLTECASGGFYIRDSHLCNGIEECPDGSDEKNCENVVCKDEEGKVLVMKSTGAWNVSRCLRCLCIEGLVACKRTLTVFFPAFFGATYQHEETCKQPTCNILEFVRNNRKWCEGVELIKDRGIIYEGQTWKANGCDFYFNGSLNYQECPLMTRPVCYVFNGFVCCASQCPALQQIAGQMRGNLSFCANGRQVASNNSDCKDTSNCVQDINIQNCSSEVTCQDEDGNQYFEGATWSVGSCMQCACISGIIRCSREVSLVKFLELTPLENQRSLTVFTERCNQPECNVAKYMEKNTGVCHACRWNDKLYYDGDHWKENGVDFFCTRSSYESHRIRPGCYVESRRVKCTGAIAGIRQLSLISNYQLFLCDSGDEIRPISDRCNIRADCEDFSDERNCENYYCSHETAHGFLWNRTRLGQQVLKECSLVNPTWTGLFGSKCGQKVAGTVWDHKHICNCENRTLLEYFKKNNAKVNSTNFLNVSEDLAISGKAKEFSNPRIFLDLKEELFLNITSRFLTPLTLDNADLALQYCLSFIDTMHRSPQYRVRNTFCKADLVMERNSLIDKALRFLRQAPNQTEAHRVGWGPNNWPVYYTLRPVWKNFKVDRQAITSFGIARRFLSLQLNMAPLVSPIVEQKTTPGDPAREKNETSKSNTYQNTTRTTHNDSTRDHPAIKQVNDFLRANNCTELTYEKEKDVFIFQRDVSAEELKHEQVQSDMEIVLLCISIAAIILALVLLTMMRLKNSERLFIHKSLLFSLGVGYLVFVLDKTLFASREDHPALCSAVAVVQHYLHTAVFTWMLVEGINLYIKLVKVFSVKKLYPMYLAIGWGVPAVIVGLVASIRPSTFDMAESETTEITCGALNLTATKQRTRCWMNANLWIYKGPILAILLVNLVLFAILLRVTFGKISPKCVNNRVILARKGLRSIIALLPLLGVTWLLGFFIEFHYILTYLFIWLNSIQGVVFFIFHCILDDEVSYH
ncbi:PREDICTED: uncharacterized protein LOC107357960 [Acropora digitifera]|uniref:uncharacterized protein LOC107357960 n=1 Tax=Acropora digitifera TaxID=70779 RepID=UPI00077A8A33|nr:PREDICTED: uncharacterized protein LOC107357960 [Acropora digitifera]